MNEKKSYKSVIISNRPGQLGNMLFLFSHFIAFGIEKKISIKAPAFEEYANYFDTTRGTLIPSYPQHNSTITGKWLRKLFYRISSLLAKIIFRLKLSNRLFSSIYIDWNESVNLEDEMAAKLFTSHYIFVRGWLYRSNALVQKHRGEIIDFFEPTDFHLNRISNLLPSRQEVLVGVHIRQGDYKTFEGGKYFFEISQYCALLNRVLTMNRGKKVLFLICSDSDLRHEDFSSIPYILGTGIAIEDLYSFAKCNFIIGPPSTFTMWASFYGQVPLYQVHDPDSEFTMKDFKVVFS